MNMNETNKPNAEALQGAPVAFDIRRISVEQLAELGVSQIAYVKPVEVNGTQGYAIHAANGAPMALAPDRDVAIAVIVQHEMVPALVH
jgi:hypothetical protein